jgi:hypothetical protein
MGLARLMLMFSAICQLERFEEGFELTFSHFLQTIVTTDD